MAHRSQVEIRKAEPKEHLACAGIYTNAWNRSLPNAQRSIGVDDFEKETAGELTLVAIVEERIGGYVSIWQPDWFMHHLYVDPALHGAGIGKALVAHSERLAKPYPLNLKCLIANTQAIGFYTSLGFVETGECGTDEYGDWRRLEKI